MIQASRGSVQDKGESGFLYEHLGERAEIWFDFIADTGDGGNSSYAIAKLLAQPQIQLREGDSARVLPRGELLLIGGDLA